MATAMEDERFARLVRAKEPRGRLLRTWALKGDVSAQVTAPEIAPLCVRCVRGCGSPIAVE